MLIFQYLNIGHFSIAPHKVNVFQSFFNFKGDSEKQNKAYCCHLLKRERAATIAIVIVRRAITTERKRSKENTPEVKQKRLRAIVLQRAIEKSLTLLS